MSQCLERGAFVTSLKRSMKLPIISNGVEVATIQGVSGPRGTFIHIEGAFDAAVSVRENGHRMQYVVLADESVEIGRGRP